MYPHKVTRAKFSFDITNIIIYYMYVLYTYYILLNTFFRGNGKAASWGVIVGFIVMMSLDVTLG